MDHQTTDTPYFPTQSPGGLKNPTGSIPAPGVGEIPEPVVTVTATSRFRLSPAAKPLMDELRNDIMATAKFIEIMNPQEVFDKVLFWGILAQDAHQLSTEAAGAPAVSEFGGGRE